MAIDSVPRSLIAEEIKGEDMNPKDLDQAAQDERNVVEAAVTTALSPYRLRSIVFLRSKEIAECIAAQAEQFIRELPERTRFQHE
jgi:hypothetical protein